jgi:hypothetical protein
MPILWKATAQGKTIRHLEANARALGESNPDFEWPDPIELLAMFVAHGFAVPLDGMTPRLEVVEIKPELAASRQHWHMKVDALHPGYARVLDNLLRAPGTDDVSFWESDLQRMEERRVEAAVTYPPTPRDRHFELSYCPPDPNVMQRDRHVEFSFVQPLATELREKVCAQLQVWIDVVWRSGFAPQGERPGDCGAIPTVAYPYDSHTVAIDFEQIFRVDEACFSSLVAYANRLASDGTPLSTLRIE